MKNSIPKCLLLLTGVLVSAGAQNLPRTMSHEEMMKLVEGSNLEQDKIELLRKSMNVAETVHKKKDKLKKLKEEKERKAATQEL
mmetsp:Transcript_17619/g.27439  ORF Transcript_17619/g.27439 Transcript_17619/m.27439 type:complete len:84 (+) Transcript_17619:102-353(+)|eukprot:CAMPEP_0196811600 /NCGR_PEP_ID=MMETSP1362-20130617/18985_1 /TAXON_ID=163516 /ORGANISM="Leptocylindrus danicus, Strain CCMP1856" /LENGTH=83 /DNA_ID=CAMNT_0042186945 /DNA_START=58 /DNA_END=309 /DNA_ORIENTATION=-